MDYQQTSMYQTNNMVRMTIKRTDDSTESDKWVCQRMDDYPELASMEETVYEAGESFPADGENLNEEISDPENWYHKIPSYLEIEMKEGENLELPWGSFPENVANTSVVHCPTSDSENIDSAGTCSYPIDLSTSHSKLESQRDITDDSCRSPSGTYDLKSKLLGNVYAEDRNAASLTGVDGIAHGANYIPGSAWLRKIPPIANEWQMNSEEAIAMAMGSIPFTSRNSPMNQHGVCPITNEFVNTEKLELVAQSSIPDNPKQEERRSSIGNYWPFSTDFTNRHSYINQSSNWSLGSEGNANAVQLRSMLDERAGGNFVNNLSENHPKRPFENCNQISNSNASNSVCPPKKKKSHIEDPATAYYCNVCDKTFKSSRSYQKHLLTVTHVARAKHVGLKQSNLHNFQPTPASIPLGPMNLLAPPQLPYGLQLFQNQMFYQQFQPRAMTPMNQYGGTSGKISSTDVQRYGPGTSKTDYKEEPLGRNRPQNYLGAEWYPQNPRHMNLPVNQTNNPQGIFLFPRNPQSENTIMANPKYLENKASQSSRAHKDVSAEIQPECSTMANSFNKSENVRTATHLADSFRIYHCMVCLTFNTDSFQELELHTYTDRSRTPLDLITVSSEGLLCTLCGFKTRISKYMAQHCTSEHHLHRVNYYNHVREGGMIRKENLEKLDTFPAVLLFCAACEYITESMDVLKAHGATANHLYNVSVCQYIESFSKAVEYCFCRPCNLKTLTKGELLKHARSKEHKENLQKFPSEDRTFLQPTYLFYIKESSLEESEPPRVSEQNEGSIFIGREQSHLKKENQEKRDIDENTTPENLISALTISPPSLAVSCSLCQQAFPEINFLVQHLEQIHGVNESGVKWIVSTLRKRMPEKVQAEKSLPTEELTNTKAGKVEQIVFSPQKSSAAEEKLPMERISIDSSCVATRQNEGSESPVLPRPSTSLQNLAIDKNSNLEGRLNTDSSLSQQFNETELMQKPDRLDTNPHLDPEGKTSVDSSASQHLCETEDMLNLGKPDENPDSNQEREISTDSPPKQQFSKTENILPVEEEKVSNSEEMVNSNSAQDDIMVESDSEMDDASSEQFSPTEIGSPISQSVFNASREIAESCSTDEISVTYERLPAKEPISSVGRSVVTDYLPSQHYVWDSQNSRSSLEDLQNLNLRISENYSPIYSLMSLAESKLNSNNSILAKIEDSVEDQMVLNACPKENETQFYVQKSTDSQIRATKNIENIEISGVFSLRGNVDDSNEEDDEPDFDIYSDL